MNAARIQAAKALAFLRGEAYHSPPIQLPGSNLAQARRFLEGTGALPDALAARPRLLESAPAPTKPARKKIRVVKRKRRCSIVESAQRRPTPTPAPRRRVQFVGVEPFGASP